MLKKKKKCNTCKAAVDLRWTSLWYPLLFWGMNHFISYFIGHPLLIDLLLRTVSQMHFLKNSSLYYGELPAMSRGDIVPQACASIVCIVVCVCLSAATCSPTTASNGAATVGDCVRLRSQMHTHWLSLIEFKGGRTCSLSQLISTIRLSFSPSRTKKIKNLDVSGFFFGPLCFLLSKHDERRTTGGFVRSALFFSQIVSGRDS